MRALEAKLASAAVFDPDFPLLSFVRLARCRPPLRSLHDRQRQITDHVTRPARATASGPVPGRPAAAFPSSPRGPPEFLPPPPAAAGSPALETACRRIRARLETGP